MNWSQLICFSTIEGELGEKHPYWKNPSKETLVNYLPTLKSKYPQDNEYRVILDHKTGNAHVWPSAAGLHRDVSKQLGIDTNYLSVQNGFIEPGPNALHLHQIGSGDRSNSHPWMVKMKAKDGKIPF